MQTPPNLSRRFALEASPGRPSFLMRDFRLNSRLLFDQHDGLGATAINRLALYKGGIVFMNPATFLSLAAPGVVHDSKHFILRGLRQNEGTDRFPLASPFLMVSFTSAAPRITGHEGRNRMRAIKALQVKEDIPVVIYPSGQSQVGVDEMAALLQGAESESGAFVSGPLFSQAIIADQAYTLKT